MVHQAIGPARTVCIYVLFVLGRPFENDYSESAKSSNALLANPSWHSRRSAGVLRGSKNSSTALVTLLSPERGIETDKEPHESGPFDDHHGEIEQPSTRRGARKLTLHF